MQLDLLQDTLKRVSVATGRNFDLNATIILHGQLKQIDEMTFREAANDYMEEESPPRNFEGYIKRRAREINWHRTKFYNPLKDKNWNNQEYTAEDQCLFFECVTKAIENFTGNKEGYQIWCAWFNRQWMDNTGTSLTDFLKSQNKALQNG